MSTKFTVCSPRVIRSTKNRYFLYFIHRAFYIKKAIKAFLKLKESIRNSKRMYNKEREGT